MVDRIVTYGSPKAGYSKLRKILKPISQTRYVNGSDAIPSHPWSLWGYRHSINEVLLYPQEEHRYKNHRIQEYIEGLQ